MKKLSWILIAVCLLAGLAAPARAADKGTGIILYTAYRQMGWGDLVQIGCVDESGALWRIEGYDSELGWPYGWEEQVAYMAQCPKEKIGELSGEELFALKGLIDSAEPQEGKPAGWMNDAGTETSRAVRRGADGALETVLLGMTGDDFFENTDPNAQALYGRLRELFPFVRCYAGMAGDWGFRAIPLRTFLGQADVSVRGAQVKIWENDCEEGPLDAAVTEEDAAQALALLQYGWVTGKANANTVTGGTYTVAFADASDKVLCSFELYRGLLVTRDGMYSLETRAAAVPDEQALRFGIGAREYVLGQSTVRDLADAGWAWEQESDGVFGFCGPEENGWFYVETEDGTSDGAILSVNLLWADGIPCACCGRGEEPGTDLWTWLKEEMAGTQTEDGHMVAYANLSDGGTVRIETDDDRPLLTLIR